MSYQEELDKFFKQRAESFKKEGIDLNMDKKMDFTYAHIECNFESLPKDAKWIEDYDDHYLNSRYESESGIGEYNFKGKVNLYFSDFKFDFSHIEEDDRIRYLTFLYGSEKTGYKDENFDELSDWSSEFDMDYIFNYYGPIPYQFAYGDFTVDDKSYNDYLILKPNFKFEEPWNGRYSEQNYKGFEIFHPKKNKFIPVILSAYSHIAECAAFEVVLNDNIPIPYVEIDKVKDYVSKLINT